MLHPYASIQYAQALQDFGSPIALTTAQSSGLVRKIATTEYQDVMGVYPRCALTNTVDLAADLKALRDQQLISLVLVSDIFCFPDIKQCQSHFDVIKPFKTHFIYNASNPFNYTKRNLINIRKAHKECHIAEIKLQDHLADWYYLYDYLIAKHHITGIQAFSKSYFEKLCQIDGLISIAAFVKNEIVAIYLWFAWQEHLYFHLGASNAQGYEARAAFAINDYVIQNYGATHIIDFGSNAGLANNPQDGLAQFKQGFTNDSATSYLCGAILNPAIYQKLCHDLGTHDYFPAYR